MNLPHTPCHAVLNRVPTSSRPVYTSCSTVGYGWRHHIYTVSLHEVWTLHLSSPAWLRPFIFWSILFKRIAGFVGLVFCYCNSESPAKPIYMNTFSNWHASTFCVWFANSHESVGMVHDQVYLENGLKSFQNGLTIIFVVGHDTKNSVPCYVVEGQALCHALGRWPKETEIPRSMLCSRW